MLTSMKDMLNKANNGDYAVAQFNINNLEWTRYILEACNEKNSPVILGVSEGAIKYMGGYNVVVALVKALIKDLNIKIDVALHLDHGSSFESCTKALDAGFTSVMIDASSLPLEENINITKKVVEYAKIFNASTEAEIGSIGGSEDSIDEELIYAKLEDALKLKNETGVDFLAPALGSVHGLYKKEPKINYDRMAEIHDKTGLPLVLHGATGLDDETLKKSILCGTSKVNINTELQVAWNENVRTYIKENEKVYDPRKIISSGEKAIKEAIYHKIEVLGSINKSQK